MQYKITEYSSFRLKANIYDFAGELFAPEEASWWVGRVGKEEPVYKETPISSGELSGELTIDVPAEANICSNRKNEESFVILRVRSGDHMKHAYWQYTIKALDTVPYKDEW